MSTEYRRGIPSTAHVEAATRLGLLWLGSDMWFRPIRPDGTPVDWEVLDQEVARVGQQGQPQTMACNLTASARSQGFRADLWVRLNEWITANWLNTLGDIETINDRGITGIGYDRRYSWDELGLDTAADEADRQALIARWTVYQELKPLYDLVDGAQGEAAMPRDVVTEWARQARGGENIRPDWALVRTAKGLLGRTTNQQGGIISWSDAENWLGQPLRNFAAVLDAVAERRVSERMRGQTQAPTVTSAQPEPRRFADVRPDRHGWRWWRQTGRDSTDLGQRFETQDGRCRWRSAHADAWFVPDTANPQMLRYTVIPTDEQGNPVSWESIEQERSAGQTAPTVTGRTATLIYVDDITTQAPSAQELRTAWDSINKTLPLPTQPPLLPRFTADELDDVDHSKTTKLDEVTLRRGKMPTVEQIAKYREVRAKRSGGTVADALKESRIDCEVAQYVLERWAGGLGDADTVLLLRAAGCIVPLQEAPKYSIRAFDPKQGEVDRRSQDFLRTHNATLDTSEKPSPLVQRERQEAEARRQRLAELRQRLAAERATQPQEMAKENDAVSRFDLIEPDPQADPAASIRAWEARQAATKVRPTAALPRIAKPATTPRRPAIEVVDAEVDGLSRSEAFAALFGRALNGGC